VDLERFDAYRPADATSSSDTDAPLIIWNHRWEADKNPRAFFNALYQLQDDGLDFRVALLGENFRQEPAEFLEARERLGARVVQFGYADSFEAYARLLWRADYVVSTAYQEFFGIAVCEAIYCGCVPLLANRLNYPYLLPDAAHGACLFRDGALAGLLRQHLPGRVSIDVNALQAYIAQHDRKRLAAVYDAALAILVENLPDSGRV
jgi:glycosyltransferase involved in cell wall biosynthesis